MYSWRGVGNLLWSKSFWKTGLLENETARKWERERKGEREKREAEKTQKNRVPLAHIQWPPSFSYSPSPFFLLSPRKRRLLSSAMSLVRTYKLKILALYCQLKGRFVLNSTAASCWKNQYFSYKKRHYYSIKVVSEMISSFALLEKKRDLAMIWGKVIFLSLVF